MNGLDMNAEMPMLDNWKS